MGKWDTHLASLSRSAAVHNQVFGLRQNWCCVAVWCGVTTLVLTVLVSPIHSDPRPSLPIPRPDNVKNQIASLAHVLTKIRPNHRNRPTQPKRPTTSQYGRTRSSSLDARRSKCQMRVRCGHDNQLRYMSYRGRWQLSASKWYRRDMEERYVITIESKILRSMRQKLL